MAGRPFENSHDLLWYMKDYVLWPMHTPVQSDIFRKRTGLDEVIVAVSSLIPEHNTPKGEIISIRSFYCLTMSAV